MSGQPACEDARGDSDWTCVEYDGTGLWCDACLAWAAAQPLGEGLSRKAD